MATVALETLEAGKQQVSDPIFCGSNSDSASALSAELAVPLVVRKKLLNDASKDTNSEGIMCLSCALVHSRQPNDVQHGIAMLEASIGNTNSPFKESSKCGVDQVAIQIGMSKCGVD
ncbi:hypothetical protein Lser_V15G00116 [Lactuca serriola]